VSVMSEYCINPNVRKLRHSIHADFAGFYSANAVDRVLQETNHQGGAQQQQEQQQSGNDIETQDDDDGT